MTSSPVARSPFVPDPPAPPPARFRHPMDSVAPISALGELVVPGSPRWAYAAILASLVGSQRGLSRLRPELLAGHRIDSDQVLADLVDTMDRRAGQVADPDPVDAPTELIADQRLVNRVAAWSRSVTLAGVCRPCTRSADPFTDPRLVALVELLAAGGTSGEPEDLLAITGAVIGRFGVDVTVRDGSLPRHIVLAARHALYAADVSDVAAELLERAQAYVLSSVSRGRPQPPTPPPLRWSCESCPLEPPPVFARQAMLLTHRGHRHAEPSSLGYLRDPFGVWVLDPALLAAPSLAEIGLARMRAAAVR